MADADKNQDEDINKAVYQVENESDNSLKELSNIDPIENIRNSEELKQL